MDYNRFFMKLPTPDSIALKHSAQLTQQIHQIISSSGGSIDFARFMALALYTPGLGYYSAGTHKLGKSGDFVTAPEISPLFAKCIARQCNDILTELKTGDILEFGAGSGIFAKDLLLELEKLNNLPMHYYILEISAELRERQQKLLQTTCPHLLARIQWLDTLPIEFRGIVFANEVMDALPAHCFRIEKAGIQERSVASIDNHFQWHLTPPSKELQARIEPLSLTEGYESEANLMLGGWIRSIADMLKQGVVLLIDYGYGQAEYYHPDRSQGTLQCYYQHHRHDDPFILVGLQDISAHVDFTVVVENAHEAGLELAGFTTQTSFLLACGLLEFAQQITGTDAEQFQQAQAIKKLTMPSQMGEAIKVMGLCKNMLSPLVGFSLHDRQRML